MIPIFIFTGCIQGKSIPYRSVRLAALSIEDAKLRLEEKYGILTYCSLEVEEECAA